MVNVFPSVAFAAFSVLANASPFFVRPADVSPAAEAIAVVATDFPPLFHSAGDAGELVPDLSDRIATARLVARWMTEESGARENVISVDGFETCGPLQLGYVVRQGLPCAVVFDREISVRLWWTAVAERMEACGSLRKALATISGNGSCAMIKIPKIASLVDGRCSRAGVKCE